VGLCAGVHGEVQVREKEEAGRTREEEAGTRQRDRREASREGLVEDAWRDLGLKGGMGAAFSETRWELRLPWGPAGLILPAIGHCLFPHLVHSRRSRFTDPNCIKEAMGAAGVDHKKIEACMEDAGGVRGGSGKGEEDGPIAMERRRGLTDCTVEGGGRVSSNRYRSSFFPLPSCLTGGPRQGEPDPAGRALGETQEEHRHRPLRLRQQRRAARYA